MDDALLIYSGGLDSTTALYQYRPAMCLNFNYGSKHNLKEKICATYHCIELKTPIKYIDLSWMKDSFKSSLLQGQGDIPEGHYEDESMRSTVVPFRNGIMLAIAAGLAESEGLKYVMYANHSGDHTIYPDCTPEFVEDMGKAAMSGTYEGISILSPYQDIDKREIALKGKALGIDYSKTWTCYNGRENHCGKCGACVERKEALNGFDSTNYER